MLIIFTVKDQKVTHDLKKPLVAGSVGIVQAAFTFDSSWDKFDKVVVFSNSSCRKAAKPQKYAGDPIDIPNEVLKPGKLYVSVIGFGEGRKRKTTQAWDVQQGITVQKCGALGDCDLLRTLVQVPDTSVATDDEVDDMFRDVFGEDEIPAVSDKYVATDDEVQEMFNEVFKTEAPVEDAP